MHTATLFLTLIGAAFTAAFVSFPLADRAIGDQCDTPVSPQKCSLWKDRHVHVNVGGVRNLPKYSRLHLSRLQHRQSLSRTDEHSMLRQEDLHNELRLGNVHEHSRQRLV